MKTKAWMSLVAAGSLALGSLAFGQTVEMTGKVLTVNNNMVAVQTESGVWQVTRGSGTKISGDLKVGATVTINCNASDAQKKEGPTSE
ncbi:MAG: hypothetical protein M3Q46_13845 [Verrucomicrobiota bacterium]|nr:hypothetical protein [Verrucomicrobiota bacterium]